MIFFHCVWTLKYIWCANYWLVEKGKSKPLRHCMASMAFPVPLPLSPPIEIGCSLTPPISSSANQIQQRFLWCGPIFCRQNQILLTKNRVTSQTKYDCIWWKYLSIGSDFNQMQFFKICMNVRNMTSYLNVWTRRDNLYIVRFCQDINGFNPDTSQIRVR